MSSLSKVYQKGTIYYEVRNTNQEVGEQMLFRSQSLKRCQEWYENNKKDLQDGFKYLKKLGINVSLRDIEIIEYEII